MLTIVQAPNPVLATKAKPVGKISKEIVSLIKQMTDTLLYAKDPEGVGLAAPQVGKSLQLFIIKEGKDDPVMVFINPVLTIPTGEKIIIPKNPPAGGSKKSKSKKEVKLEGCLSLQDIWGIVHRYEKISLSYLDEKGTHHKRMFDNFLATIIQHEYDHLQGTLFPRRVLEQGGQLYKSTKNADGEVEFEEIII